LSFESGSYNQTIKDIVFQIGADCHAIYGATGTSVTLNGLENEGELYGERIGYLVTLDQDHGGDFTKGKTALGHIRSERPCGFEFDSNRDGTTDHFAVIEGVKYKEHRNWIFWYDHEMWYLVNYGWGSVRRWICVDDQYVYDQIEYKKWGIPFIQVKFVTPAKAGVQRAIVAINIDSAFTGMTL